MEMMAVRTAVRTQLVLTSVSALPLVQDTEQMEQCVLVCSYGRFTGGLMAFY